MVDLGIGRILLNALVHCTVSSDLPRSSRSKLELVHDVSTSFSRLLNLYMIRCRWDQHCSHVGGEWMCVLNHM